MIKVIWNKIHQQLHIYRTHMKPIFASVRIGLQVLIK